LHTYSDYQLVEMDADFLLFRNMTSEGHIQILARSWILSG
jgi:hypothetical protein